MAHRKSKSGAGLSYEALIATAGIDGLSSETALERIGHLIDQSHDLSRDDGTTRALEWCDALAKRRLPAARRATLSYFKANAWANKVKLRHTKPAFRWRWEQPEVAQQILFLREALNSSGFDELHPARRCQIFTNLGNQLNHVGRSAEALEYWSRALTIEPHFWMARGNRGSAFIDYAKALYDRGHSAALLLTAHRDLTAALASAASHPRFGYTEAAEAFAERKAHVEVGLNVSQATKSIKFDGYELGGTSDEQHYRRWCLDHCLFLNPLNDLGPHSIAARDVLMLPGFTTGIKEPPSIVGYFNQMKQEYASARWLCYEGVHATELHFSDRGVGLINTLDYPSYSLAVEKVKAAYRIAYSLFDKAAFFLNTYMKLKMDPKRVSFRYVWHEAANRAAPVRRKFETSENWPFRGLYWLSKDIFDEKFQETTEPDARALYEIRNHLEHKYLKVHEMRMPTASKWRAARAFTMDDMAYSVWRREFEENTLRVLKLSRAALVYLSLGMHREEQRRAERRERPRKGTGKKPGSGLVVPIHLDPWDDEWKR